MYAGYKSMFIQGDKEVVHMLTQSTYTLMFAHIIQYVHTMYLYTLTFFVLSDSSAKPVVG